MRASIIVVLALHALLAFADDDVSSSEDSSISTSNSTEIDDDVSSPEDASISTSNSTEIDDDEYAKLAAKIKPLSEDDEKRFATCKNNDCNSTAWESSGQTQGDMIISNDSQIVNRYGVTYMARWPGAKLIYSIDNVFNNDELHAITFAMKSIESKTCVRFVQRTNEPGYVFISNKAKGCNAEVGYTGRSQTLNLNSEGCIAKQVIMHEIMHSLGFMHEQSGHDRDNYVTINFSNVKTDMKFNFDKDTNTDNFRLPYDYRSLMHYGRKAFSFNDQDTIIPIKPGFIDIIGNAVTLSPTDIKRVNRMYNCPFGQ